jgi:hypothetical protein
MGIRKCKTIFSMKVLSKDFTKIKTGRPEEQARKQCIMAIAELCSGDVCHEREQNIVVLWENYCILS